PRVAPPTDPQRELEVAAEGLDPLQAVLEARLHGCAERVEGVFHRLLVQPPDLALVRGRPRVDFFDDAGFHRRDGRVSAWWGAATDSGKFSNAGKIGESCHRDPPPQLALLRPRTSRWSSVHAILENPAFRGSKRPQDPRRQWSWIGGSDCS